MILSPLGYAQLGKKIPAVKYPAKLTIVSHGGTLTPIQEGSNAIITKRDEGGIDAIYEARSTRWRTPSSSSACPTLPETAITSQLL